MAGVVPGTMMGSYLTGWTATNLAAGSQASVTLADFGRWMASEQRRIYWLCLRLLRDSHEADSATQDTFLRAHRALEQDGAAPIDDPPRWLTRVAVNTCMDRLRSRRWKFWQQLAPAGEQEGIGQLTVAGPGPEDALFAREIAGRLSQALDKLSLRQRSVFVLRHDEDLSLQQIAEILDLDPGTVKAHMHRALCKLRDELRDLYG
ncbi:MAG: RNA polymerase sigma factor [Acidobacteriota bacterium]